MIYKFSFIEKILLSNDIIPHPFADAASSVGLGFALSCAVKLKIADQLSLEMKPVASIAQGAHVSEIGARLILDCLEAMGYVKEVNGNYAFNKRGYKNLSPESPENFRHFILFCDFLYKGYSKLDETVKLGRRTEASMLEIMTDYEWELFSRAMIDISSTNCKEVARKITVRKTYTRILDLGGSHGLYSIELCKKHPQIEAVIVDFPQVEKYALECIKKHNMQERVSFIPMDFMKDELPQGFDLVLAFNIIHGMNASENDQLASKVFKAIQQGGQFIILDQIKGIGNGSQLSKATTSYMALNLLHQTGGKTYSKEEVDQFTMAHGFKKSLLKKLNAPGFGLIACQK